MLQTRVHGGRGPDAIERAVQELRNPLRRLSGVVQNFFKSTGQDRHMVLLPDPPARFAKPVPVGRLECVIVEFRSGAAPARQHGTLGCHRRRQVAPHQNDPVLFSERQLAKQWCHDLDRPAARLREPGSVLSQARRRDMLVIAALPQDVRLAGTFTSHGARRTS